MSIDTISNYHPLALNPWNGGENSYIQAHNMIDERVNGSENALLRADDELRLFACCALERLILDHANANWAQFTRLRTALAAKGMQPDPDLTSGNGTPSQLLNYLHQNESMESIEEARLTLIGSDSIVDGLIDCPVQADLYHPYSGSQATIVKDPAHYNLKQFDLNNQFHVILDRKRPVFSHYDGSILSKVRRPILVSDSREISKSFADYLAGEYGEFTRTDKVYRYDRVPEELYGDIEDALTHGVGTTIIPLATTYFGYRKPQTEVPPTP